jgi:peptidoglycan/LPS O-acetylase OafA/YrhL
LEDARNQRAWLDHARAPGWWPLVLLGYSVYLLHHLVVRWRHVYAPTLGASHPALACAVFWVVVLGASGLAWASVEQPCRRVLLGRSVLSPAEPRGDAGVDRSIAPA